MHLDWSPADHLQVAQPAVAAQMRSDPVGDHRLQLGQIGPDLPVDRPLTILLVRASGMRKPDRPAVLDQAIRAGVWTFEPLAPEATRLARYRIGRHGTGAHRHSGEIDHGFDEHLSRRVDTAVARVHAAGRRAQSGAQRERELVVNLAMRRVEPPGRRIVHAHIRLGLRLKQRLTLG